uniref:Uncharacterized protein n=1 Tax=Lactuca sativa TaxID=4236 RepID=A0A9R1XMI2_LACSA|nr:hypothetical protein LSAT_V11C300132530 [Lactuca sativa]
MGKDIYFDLVDHEKVHSFRIQKNRCGLTISRYSYSMILYNSEQLVSIADCEDRHVSVIPTIYFGMQEEVVKEFGIPIQCQRFWIWAKRQNHTYSPNRPLTPKTKHNMYAPISVMFLILINS